jgi:class 3 adenylate cyclase
LVEVAGDDRQWWVGDSEAIVNQIQAFLTGERGAVDSDRALLTVLFTDIVDSTRRSAQLDDRR